MTDTLATTSDDIALDWREPLDAFAPLAGEPMALLMLSGGTAADGMSFIFADPDDAIIGDGAAAFERARDAWRARRGEAGGLGGLFGYELGGDLVGVARGGSSDWPEVAVGLYGAVATFDHKRKRLTVAGRDAGRLAARLGRAGTSDAAPVARPRLTAARPPEAFEASVARALTHVRAGDIYQANLSQRFDAAPVDAPYTVFRRLAQASPAPHAAFLRLGADRAVATHSPERFLSFDAAGRVETRPIKGTRPRGTTPLSDAALAAELVASAKDRAENLMIVDLMRNDLARACAPGSVRVEALNALETHANVHHLVSTVAGRLAPGRDAFDQIAAAFPPGSVTGAPKMRAMEIIAALEGEARGPYCGALGRLGFDGAGDFNVMIRTIAFTRAPEGWRARFRSGGGITIGSDPRDERDETLDKATSIAAALGVALERGP